MLGSLILPCSKLVMWPCGFAGHWEVFSSGRGLVPLERGGFEEGCISARKPILSPPQLCVRAARAPSPAQRRDPEGPSVSHPAAAPLPSSPTAPFWPYLPGTVAPAPPAPPGQSVGNTRALSVGQLWEGLPAIPNGEVAPVLGLREPAHSCCAGASAVDIVTAPH